MPRPAFELADIFRQFGPAFRAGHKLPLEQLRVMRAVEVCRTATLGGHVERCDQCEYQTIAYNSCRNRHCPKCQNSERVKWLEDRTTDLLPVPYYHVVFTIPEELARLAFYNKETVYGSLFRTAAETLSTIARDPKHLGAELGFFGILHTWGQNLSHHPHLHFVVPGGGLSPGYERWIPCLPGFFLPVRVLSRLFRRLFLEALEAAFDQNQLHFAGELEPIREPSAFRRYLAPLREREWVVYSKPPFGGPQQVLAYLGRYTHRVAIANQRILNVGNGNVTFQWNDYRQKDKYKSRTMTVPAAEFIRRFLVHTLPPGFQRIRHFGFLANRFRKEKLALCRKLLTPAAGLLPDPAQCRELAKALDQTPPQPCPSCQKGTLIRLGFVPGYLWPERPPDTS